MASSAISFQKISTLLICWIVLMLGGAIEASAQPCDFRDDASTRSWANNGGYVSWRYIDEIMQLPTGTTHVVILNSITEGSTGHENLRSGDIITAVTFQPDSPNRCTFESGDVLARMIKFQRPGVTIILWVARPSLTTMFEVVRVPVVVSGQTLQAPPPSQSLANIAPPPTPVPQPQQRAPQPARTNGPNPLPGMLQQVRNCFVDRFRNSPTGYTMFCEDPNGPYTADVGGFFAAPRGQRTQRIRLRLATQSEKETAYVLFRFCVINDYASAAFARDRLGDERLASGLQARATMNLMNFQTLGRRLQLPEDVLRQDANPRLSPMYQVYVDDAGRGPDSVSARDARTCEEVRGAGIMEE